MTKNNIKSYNKRLMNLAIESTKIGATIGIGTGVIGTIGGLAGPAAAPAIGASSAALSLVGVGQVAKVGMGIIPKEVIPSGNLSKGLKKNIKNNKWW